MKIIKDDAKRDSKSMPDWKGTEPDKVHSFWFLYMKC